MLFSERWGTEIGVRMTTGYLVFTITDGLAHMHVLVSVHTYPFQVKKLI